MSLVSYSETSAVLKFGEDKVRQFLLPFCLYSAELSAVFMYLSMVVSRLLTLC